jgi:hypothetical protein
MKSLFFYRTPNCQRILMFAESPGGSRRTAEKKGGMIFNQQLILKKFFFRFLFINRSSFECIKII